MIFWHFFQVNNLFLHLSYIKKNAKNHFLLLKKLKNTESAQLYIARSGYI